MQVLFVLTVALAQGLAFPSDIEISNLPSEIEISNLPSHIGIEISNLPSDIESQGGIEISHLPADIEATGEIEISHLPSEIESHDGIEISHLPAEIELPSGIEISHLPAEIELPSGIEISHLPAELPAAEAEATPSCVKYVRTLLEEVLRALPGGQAPVESPSIPEKPQQVPVESACTRCFQKLQLLIENANSRNSAALTF